VYRRWTSRVCQPTVRSVSEPPEAEPAFVRDEAEEKNNGANESPTVRHSDRSIVSSIISAESASSRLVLFCVNKHGIDRVDGSSAGLYGWYCALTELSLYFVCRFSCSISIHMVHCLCNQILYLNSNTPHLSAVLMFAMRGEVRSVVRARE